MDDPIALKVLDGEQTKVHRVSINAQIAKALKPRPNLSGRAIIIARDANVLANRNAGLVDGSSVIATIDGDWSDAILIVLPPSEAGTGDTFALKRGDDAFLASVAATAPHLSDLARRTIRSLRAAAVEGELVQDGSGRWVNRPINMLTLKPQPRVQNLAFTIYGNPDTFDAGDFLRQDQNSYSRGWISSANEIDEFVRLAKLSQARRIG